MNDILEIEISKQKIRVHDARINFLEARLKEAETRKALLKKDAQKIIKSNPIIYRMYCDSELMKEEK